MKHFIVIQIGARRNYLVPHILDKAGLLEAFYTDICANTGLGAILDRICPKPLRRGSLNQLLNRRVPPNLEEKVFTYDWLALKYLIKQKLTGYNLIKQYQALCTFNQEFGQATIRKGLGRATHIFSMFGEGISLLEFAKQQGIKIVTDIYISPSTHSIVQAEREKFPDLEPVIPPEIIQKDHSSFARLCEVTDIFLVPSQFVEKGLKEFGVTKDKCRLVPYAVNDFWLQLKNHPIKGRILFVGTAELRKGIHILGMASQKLSHNNYEFRVAGNVADSVRHHKLTQHLTFLDRVPRFEIHQEYTLADIFVLPSLAEGSAEVTYQALASGLPVITTEAAGSVIRDGIDGFIVPEGDSETLAKRIEELIENRKLRNRMSIAARERAREYTSEKYSERLLAAINTL
ncbi:glycosyltransferase family 4 protein [Aetokthonos hydrillicola Thurmond2011]|jgi:glycosyltransferase involved in cell wall biosynthesis|uniref:Glycosyltransferase family 4 protein n=1 Tax=Aetokthonos hydrillicola Thurmond2011 TaxID=2712845 RepID=A0AAP5I8B1_9CYAN|nr:glycosyltransferase family 4 protein [Aetokthonos hydrillicola]MBO3459255.1 glycosyltransferase family 4 protein [Aetokthonos hydrillicola CCALA 1050]MBW4584911.1 glycosyltransferase family 4 protein [Aetokthonos hydrillicola CCALA 1050]MDR9894330.1 glycosyltransferase family 4 protein [Aetokthonos hydrillicola Thurmond2011]